MLGLAGLVLFLGDSQWGNHGTVKPIESLLGFVLFIATGLWYVLRGANAEPPTRAKPKRNTGTSGSNQVIGAFGLLIIVTSAVASLLYGPELGYNQLVSVSVGVIAGFLLSFLLMLLLVATRIYIANRRDTRRLRAAFAAGDHEAVDNILMERARRQGFTEAQYREITSKQRADLEKRFRSRIASIEAVLRRSGPIGFSAQRQIDEALDGLGSELSTRAKPGNSDFDSAAQRTKQNKPPRR